MSQTTGTSHEKSQQWGQLGQWKVRWAPILQEADRSYTCRVEKGPHSPPPPATRGAATREVPAVKSVLFPRSFRPYHLEDGTAASFGQMLNESIGWLSGNLALSEHPGDNQCRCTLA